MGKIRVKTIGSDEEQEQKKQAKKRVEAKKLEKIEQTETTAEDKKEEVQIAPKEPEAKETKKKKTYTDNRTKGTAPTKYKEARSLVDKKTTYSLADALVLLPKLKVTKFDETVELHINTIQTGISGSMNLPHGTGKKMRVAIANAAKDPNAVDELVKKVESGTIDFDILLATPDAMPSLAKIAKFLGPRGLMPNPKNGTVNPDPEKVAKQYEGGQMNFKTELKAPIIHLTVGKVSFGNDKLSENIKTALNAVQAENITSITLKSTMSPGIKLNPASL